MLRNGVLDLIERHEQGLHRSIFDFKSVNLNYKWFETGKSIWDDPQYDIIATISPEAMNEAVALSQQPSQEELSKGRVVSRFEWGDIPKMNPEGHELAAKVWNERYVEAVKNSAKQADRYAEHLAAVSDEVETLRKERDAAILWIRRLANNPRKPATWMQTRDDAANFLAALPNAERELNKDTTND